MTYSLFATVVLDRSIKMPLDYGVPIEMVESIRPGMRVMAPLRGKPQKGTVLSIQNKTALKTVCPLISFQQEKAVLNEDLFQLASWMSKYYCTPMTKCLSTQLPSSVKKDMKAKEQFWIKGGLSLPKLAEYAAEIRAKFPKQAEVIDGVLKHPKGLLQSELLAMEGVSKSSLDTLVKKKVLEKTTLILDRSLSEDFEFFPTTAKQLNDQQQDCLDKIKTSLNDEAFSTHLIHGVTGSGKTEVYMQAMESALDMGKSIIMLVPEIALTTQTIERLKSRFQQRIAILHHRLSDGERFDAWQGILKGEVPIVVGARSAIFSPVKNLGLIIVDEEQESSYKQSEDMPCYHARDVAVVRGKLSKATVVLGSATPSIETFYNAQAGKYQIHTLPHRAGKGTPPKTTIVDMKLECEREKGFTLISPPLLKAIRQRIDTGEQTILFLNRRGYYTCQVCSSCQEAVKCPHCDVSLTYHRSEDLLSCHICDYNQSPHDSVCKSCNEKETLKYRGPGTEQLQRALHAMLPDVRTLRMDRDTTKHKGSHDQIFKEFKSQKADVLIGTQMIAKGLHFPNVTLVGIIGCDSSLNIPDFRSNEYTFQLLTQVAGRSGRESLEGEVYIQTFLHEHDTIQLAAREDYKAFFAQEIQERKDYSNPPFSRLIKITFTGKDLNKVQQHGEKYQQILKRILDPKWHRVGPLIPSGYAKIKDKHRMQCILKTKKVLEAGEKIRNLPIRPKPSVNVLIDIDPTHTFF